MFAFPNLQGFVKYIFLACYDIYKKLHANPRIV